MKYRKNVSRNAVKYASTIKEWLDQTDQTSFFYYDLPAELKNFALFQKARAHETIIKTGKFKVSWQDHKAFKWKVNKRFV